MQRFALTAEQLAQVYVYNAIDFGPGKNYLFDTPDGCCLLLQVAGDVLRRITARNNPSVSDESREEAVRDLAFSRLQEDPEFKGQVTDDYLEEKASELGIGPISWGAAWSSDANAFDEMWEVAQAVDAKFVENELERGILDPYESNASDVLREAIEKLGTDDPAAVWQEFQADMGTFAFDSKTGELLLTDFVMDDRGRRDMFERWWADSEEVHLIIADEAETLSDRLGQATAPDADREDFAGLMEKVDRIVSLAHHGGPLIEYTAEKPIGGQEPGDIWDISKANPMPQQQGDPVFSVVNEVFAKGGPLYTALVRSLGLLPEQAEAYLQKHLKQKAYGAYVGDVRGDQPDQGRGYNTGHSREDYYKHPFFANRSQWMQTGFPAARSWRTGDPERLARENARLIMEQTKKSEQALAQQGGWGQHEKQERLTKTRNWAGWFLHNQPPLSERLAEIAEHLDRRGVTDLADRVDQVGTSSLSEAGSRFI